MFSTQTTRSQRRAFTLIELLVVIAIIAILAAILFPVFAKARAQARKIAGLSNMKQLGTATMMYVQDYDEMFPYYNWGQMSCSESGGGKVSGTDPAFAAYSQAAWCNSLMPYVKNVGVFQDPSDKRKWRPGYCINFPHDQVYQPGEKSWLKSSYVSYGWNESASGKSLASFQNPASDLLWSDYVGVLVDTWGRFNWTQDFYVRRAIWSDLNWKSNDIRGRQSQITEEEWEANKEGIRHETGVNVSFMDGHAKFIQARRNLREVGPDIGQIVPGGGSKTPPW